MKKIVILGAKPDAKLIKGDVIITSNVSIGYYPEYIKSFKERIAIVGEGLLLEERVGHYANKKNRITQEGLRLAPKIVIRVSDYVDLKPIIEKWSLTHEIELFRKRKYQRKYLSLFGPIIQPFFFEKFSSINILIKKFFYIFLVEFLLKRKKFRFPPETNVSTGVAALLYAIDMYKNEDVEYVIVGIGASKRSSYSFGTDDDIFYNDINHLVSDFYALKKLSKKFNISTTDKELAEMAQIREV